MIFITISLILKQLKQFEIKFKKYANLRILMLCLLRFLNTEFLNTIIAKVYINTMLNFEILRTNWLFILNCSKWISINWFLYISKIYLFSSIFLSIDKFLNTIFLIIQRKLILKTTLLFVCIFTKHNMRISLNFSFIITSTLFF